MEWRPADGSAAEPEFELYDYQEDPLESVNLAARQPETPAELRRVLSRHPAAQPPRRK